MLFNSWEFLFFFLTVYVLYIVAGKLWLQNILLLVASYFFYASWNWKFLGLIVASTTVDYLCGLGIQRVTSSRARRSLLIVSLVFNLGLLGVFKYYGFFAASLIALADNLGLSLSPHHLSIVLPVGISFYTFQTLSYTIDIYRGNLKPTKSLLNFALFVAFFPQLVAGPIERAKSFLPQIEAPRTLEIGALRSGGWLIFWGLWKKVVVADNLGMFVDSTFDASATTTAAMAYLAVVAFCFQIYCDFSGYSDIARGIARLLGFELMLNFDLPYLACNPSEFWRKWHISLSTWLRDYLYIPLGGGQGNRLSVYRNLMITMTLGGLWHGAAWNFVWWGIFHGLLLVAHRAFRTAWPAAIEASFGRRLCSRLLCFHSMAFGFLIFRCTRKVNVDGYLRDDSYAQFVEMISAGKNGVGLDNLTTAGVSIMAIVLIPLFVVQAIQMWSKDLEFIVRWPFMARCTAYALLLLMLVLWGVGSGDAFIYFQF